METHDEALVVLKVRPKTRRLAQEIAQLEERPLFSVVDRALMLYLRQRAVASYDVSDPSTLTPEELALLNEETA